jgi:hypothetical protein
MSTRNPQIYFEFNKTCFHIYKEGMDETYRLEISAPYNDNTCVLLTERTAMDLIASLQLIQSNELKLQGCVDQDKLSYLDAQSRKSRERKILEKAITEEEKYLDELKEELYKL